MINYQNFEIMKYFKILIKLFLTIVLSWIILLLFSHLNHYSKFNHYELNFEKYKHKYQKFEQSAQKVKKQLANLVSKKKNYLFFNRQDAKYLCVGIISKRRNGNNPSNYVQQSIVSLLSRVSLKREDKLRIIAFNTDDFPEENHQLVQFKYLIKVVNITSNVKSPNPRVKEAMDYSMMLEYFFKLNCSYSILNEDDSIFAENWFEILFHNLKRSELSAFDDWFLCKLFSGYIFFDISWVKNPNLAIFCRYIYTLILTCSIQICLHRLIIGNKLNLIYFVFFFINSTIQTFVYISTSVSPQGDGFQYFWTGFGTVSVLYPQRSLQPLSLFLKEIVTSYVNKSSDFFEPKDLLIDCFREKNNFKEIIISPSLVQHTGMHSSLMFKEISSNGFRRMYKSFSFIDDLKVLNINQNVW